MQVNCFVKHAEMAKTKVGLEYFSEKKKILNFFPSSQWRILSQILTHKKHTHF